MGKKEQIEFNPVQCPQGGGYIALEIYPPGTFIRNKHFSVFVGGCGVGERRSEEEARSYLFEAALLECDRRITEARKIADHYTLERKRLIKDGLVLKKPGT